MPTPLENEFGTVAAIELKRLTKRGAMQPLLCRADDGEHYVFKPFSTGSAWPLTLEWVCARLGRDLGLPIPNYRQVFVANELAAEWNEFNERQIEGGIGFGSRLVPSALEFDATLSPAIPEALRLRVLAFDWWIRNPDRSAKNPNLLWSADTRALHVIDHDQAARPDDASLFWGTHLFTSLAPAVSPWLPPAMANEFAAAAARLLPAPVAGELPSTWTSDPGALPWFVRQLTQSLIATSHRDWRNHD